jgi:hypothetical protein
MRKIEIALLSALIIYDYSAQSLANDDSISFGHSFITNNIDEKSENDDFSFMPNLINADIKEMVNLQTDVKQKNIGFHTLAKLNPSTAFLASKNINADVRININMPADADIDAPETFITETQLVDINKTTYYSTALSNTKKIDPQPETFANPLTFDTDNDGVYDVEDRCVDIAGVARFEGCPVPDSDADGINDEEDRCPLVIGIEGNYGCPAVAVEENMITAQNTIAQQPAQVETSENNEIAAIKNNQFVFKVGFKKENNILSTDDFNKVLQFTDILIQNADAKVEIECVTNTNSTLQQTPAELLNNYFKDLGVSENQIIIKKQTKEINQTINEGISKLEMRIRL